MRLTVSTFSGKIHIPENWFSLTVGITPKICKKLHFYRIDDSCLGCYSAAANPYLKTSTCDYHNHPILASTTSNALSNLDILSYFCHTRAQKKQVFIIKN